MRMAKQIRQDDMYYNNRQHEANQEFRNLRKIFDEENQAQI